MSDPTAPVEGAQETPAAPDTSTPPSFDMSPVLDRMTEMAGSIDGRFAALEQRIPQPDQPAEADPWADLFPDDPNQGVDQYGNPVQPQQPQMDPQALQGAIQAAIQQNNAPLAQELAQMRLERATEQLYQRIPQLADTPENQQTRQETAARVQQALQRYSPQEQQKFGNDPGFIELVFKAAEAEKLAQGQAPAGGQPPSLEAAGGALPGGNGEPVNPVHQAYGSQPQGLAKGFN